MTENNPQNNQSQMQPAVQNNPNRRPQSKGRYRRAQNAKPKRQQDAQNKPAKPRRNPLEGGQGRRPFYHRNPTAGEKLVDNISSLISHSIKNFVFCIFVSVSLFCVGGYFMFERGFLAWGYSLWFLILAGCFIFGASALFGLIYGVAMAALYTVKSFSQNIGALVRETVNRVKNSIESKIDNVEGSISRSEVIGVIKQAFEELVQNIKRYARRTAAGVLAVGILGGAIYLARNFLIKSAVKIKNKAEFFTLLSARTALILAVILNLTFFAKLGIFIGYLLGIMLLMAQFLIAFTLM